MADDGALRQRRFRLHRSGDHSACKQGNCPELTAAVAGDAAPGQFARALDQLVAGLGLEPGDPRLIDVVMCRALAGQVDRGSPVAVRQVRELLAGVTVQRPPPAVPDPDDIVAKHVEARRRRRAAHGWPS